MNITETTSLNAILSETGKIYLSVDGYGTLDQTGSVQILKKPDATVRKAYLVGDGTNFSAIGTTATLNGTTVNWDRIESTSFFYSYLADVTDLLKPTIDSAASGTFSIALDEGSETYSYEGLALAVLFDDPNQTTDNSVILYFGGLPQTGATSIINFSSPVDLSQVSEATLGLGIGFSYAAAGQTSQVSVNGQPLTLVAGNYDDGVSGASNGALFTVGGFEDNPDNPSPVSTDPETDDELYNLLPFINNGDSSLTLNTVNPSNDDHIFFAHLTLEGIQTTSIPSIISFSGSTYEVLEDGSAINSVTLTRSGSVIGEASVTLTPTDGTAIAGNDYDGTPIVVNFADGQTTAIITIPIIDNTVYQGDKTINLALSDPTDGAILGSQITSLLTIVENDSQSQLKYSFTYFYGNGDSYSGYVYAAEGTYDVGQLPDYYDNETGSQQGYYVIDSVEDGEAGTNGYVQITSYKDDDTGFGITTSIGDPDWGDGIHGYSGLGSESGYAYNANNSGDNYFSNYSEADLPGVVQVRLNLLADDGGNPGELIANNQIGVNKSFFVEILVADLRGNAVGVNGLGLDLAWDGFILESINFDPALAINPNFVLLPDGSLDYDGLISNLSGGSLPEFELGQAIGINQLERFALLHFYTENSSNGTSYLTTTVGSASLADDASYSLDVEENQPIEILSSYNQYNFTYNYGNGDFYTGYVYALEGTYAAGQVLEGYYNETGNYGSYTIDSISSSTFDSWYNNQIYITSYYDGDTGYGYANILNSGTGYSGLTSEYGWVYDANWSSSDSYFDYYNEADILGNQLFNYTYHYGNGDSYSGYGYAAVDTYTVGQTIGYYGNETGNDGYYIIDSVELGNTSTGYNGYIYVTSYYDADTGFGTAGYVNSGTGYYGLTSEYGYAYDSNGYSSDPYFSYYSEADILNQYYTFTYTYGNGDSYSGYGYALAGTYAEGQTIDYGYNETGSYGFYTINSVSAGTADSWYNNQVYVTSYYDGDTGYGYADLLDSYTGYSGLGSEYGYAYDSGWSSSDSYFDRYYEADILGNQLFNYTYHYGNGDSYSGYGYAAVDTYTVGQTIDYGYNETGNYGYYTIDSVELGNTSTGYNGYVYITSYTDGDTSYAYGTTTNVGTNWGYPLAGIYGLSSEYGYAYTAEGTSHDSYFSNYYEADLTVPSISITDNSGDIFDASIKFTTELSKFRKNYSDSDFVRPNYADSSKYFDITNTGTGLLTVSGLQINVAGVTTDLDLTEGDLLLNPNQSQRVQLTYTAAAAKEVFNRSDALVLFTNALDLPEFAIALSGKSTFNSDINYNGIVNTGDLGALNQARSNYNKGILDPTADINGDGMINSLDVSVLLSENKQSVFV